MKSIRLLLIALSAVVLVFVVVFFGVPILIGSDVCRDWVNRSLNRSLRSEGTLGPITINGGNLYSPTYTGKGNPNTQIASIQAQDLSAQLNWLGLLSGVCNLEDVAVKKVDLVIGTPPPDSPDHSSTANKTGLKLPNIIHPTLKISQVAVNEVNLHWSGKDTGAQVTGMHAEAIQRGEKLWDLSAKGGTVEASGWPAMQIDQATGSYGSNAVTVTQAKLIVSTGGSLAMNGSINLDAKRPYKLHGNLAGISLNDLATTKWNLQGVASGSFDFTGDLDEANSGQITGVVHLDRAKLNWSFLLGKVRRLVEQLGLNDWQLDGVDMQVSGRGSHFEFSNLVVKYQDLLRVEGSGTIDSNQINANLNVGLSPSLLSWLPGVQEKVFKEERDGLAWATMQVTGTIDNPKEDLSKRMSDALSQSLGNQFKNQAKGLLDSLLGQ